MSDKPAYKLSASLEGHSADVRCVSASGQGAIVFSSSRDGTARSWLPTAQAASTSRYTAGPAFTGQHEGFLNACCWVKGPEGGYLVTGGQDKIIAVWPLPSQMTESSTIGEPSHLLIGHEGNVCALDASQDGSVIVSGSWDKTARVWKDFQLLHTLHGHDQAVWAVLSVDSAQDLVLTGAADNMIRLWRGNKAEKVYKGHTQPVRALAKLGTTVEGGDLFASAGNDGSIRIWSLKTGDAVHVLNGHDSFVYSLSPIPDSVGGGLVSGGEDRSVRVWRGSDGECEQTITVPAVSVWSVKCLENGDVAVGSSDSIVRIFTRAKDREADGETLAAYEQTLASTTINSQQVGDVKKSDLPGPEALASPGKKEGQVIMVKTAEGSVEAHQWSSAERSWQKIGEVVDAVGQGRKQLYEGQEYDYVFDIDVGDGMPKLKLPYNVTQNPYEAAQKFLIRNELPMEYMNQIVEFIDKNTGSTQLGQSEFVDPYTGASRYTGGSSSRPAAGSSSASGGDPFTGGGRRDAPTVSSSLIPHRTYLSFSQANLAALRAKIGQLNDQAGDHALDASSLATLDQLIARLLASSTSKATLSLSSEDEAVLLKLLRWRSDQVFPVLDLLRMVALSCAIPDLLPDILEVIGRTDGPAKEIETNSMLALRAVANMLSSEAGRSVAREEAATIIAILESRGLSGLSKNGKVALATISLNYSILAYQGQLDGSAVSQLASLCGRLLEDRDSETVYRTLIAAGNLVAKKQATELKAKAKTVSARLAEDRIKAVVAEIERL